MRRIKRPTAALYGACSVVWTIRVITEIVDQTYWDSVFWFTLDLICAALWIGAFIVSVRRSRSGGGRED